ncbi:MAG: bifunctional tRNA (5-methylaminomethyl-2-thiouridine)(34)-methyltransferase MnmD/FAD-dependent 5-carboxymethylaminomethyl-2-thiouridine(34) oxidoreductase MnmC [Rickettsiales bacterium]
MTLSNAHLDEPELELRDDDTPVSAVFGDVYFSRAGGIQETTHVFLKGNGLPNRWQGRERFTIGELGFGTGLNFLVTLKRFQETAGPHTTLHYVAVEKFPLSVGRLKEILALQPELEKKTAELLATYPLRLPGMHRVKLGNVYLTLCFGDVAELLPQWDVAVDAWYLDGFSPAKNAAMWDEAVLAQVGRLSAPGATFATFTAAGAVKRGLQAAGFAVEKVGGFGHKREMLVGSYAPAVPEGSIAPYAALTPAASGSPWNAAHGSCQGLVVIIGAGIAGATLARALAERGKRVAVLERNAIASGASGNAAAVLFPQITKQWNASTDWYFTAYGFALRQLRRWTSDGLAFAHGQPAMLRLPRHAEEEAQLRTLNDVLGLDKSIVHWVEREVASAQAGMELTTGAAFFPDGAWISPPQLCAALLQHDHIMLREGDAVESLHRSGEDWVVTLACGEEMLASQVCVASAQESAALLSDYGLRLNAVGGQVSEFAANDVVASLRSILCHKGYIIPRGATYLVGATYHRENMLMVTEARHAENIAELETVLPGWFRGEVTVGRSSMRATTPDRMPYVGAVDDGLYVSTGHGSRGMLSGPLAAEMIAGAICQEMSPVSARLVQAVRPFRFTKT